MLNNNRRRAILKSAVAMAGVTAIPHALHAGGNDSKGIDAPRVGLVIGNGGYTDSPLTNPVNDAKAMAQSLGVLGFQTQLLLNATLKELSEAVDDYVEQLRRQKAVGLFYYAGHGVQLGWRNYIIPIGSKINRLDDVPKQAYELNIMLGALSKAKNPMNIIILDACRDNPFGKRLLPEQKGLSQFDAPIGSLLSYATAPGNTASDGSGKNGLFTENFLREMKMPLAKIEDVFKRVRLNVRLKSNGAQIPWESTSLEDDFYFIANEAQFKQVERDLVQGREQAEAELNAQLNLQKQSLEQKIKAELILWEKALGTQTAAGTEDYLKRYPSGSYSELALARLDALLFKAGEKKLAVQSNVDNPYTKGSVSGLTRYTIGDQFTFEDKDPYTDFVSRTYTETVTRVSEEQIEFDGGNRIVDVLGNVVKTADIRYISPVQFHTNTYALGQSWNSTFGWFRRGLSSRATISLSFKVESRERFVSTAGIFNAFKIVGMGYFASDNAKLQVTYWIDPEKCSCPIVFELRLKNWAGNTLIAERNELIAFQQRA